MAGSGQRPCRKGRKEATVGVVGHGQCGVCSRCGRKAQSVTREPLRFAVCGDTWAVRCQEGMAEDKTAEEGAWHRVSV